MRATTQKTIFTDCSRLQVRSFIHVWSEARSRNDMAHRKALQVTRAIGRFDAMTEVAEPVGPTCATMFPLEFHLTAVPLSLQASGALKERWKGTVAQAARQRAEETVEFIWLDDAPVAVTIFYFPTAPMAGDVDNIVKPILDALNGHAYTTTGWSSAWFRRSSNQKPHGRSARPRLS